MHEAVEGVMQKLRISGWAWTQRHKQSASPGLIKSVRIWQPLVATNSAC